MAGFSTLQDFYSEVFPGGKNCNFQGRHVASATVGTGGRWYNASFSNVVPAANDWGNLVQNPLFTGGYANWTLGANWTWSTSGYMVHATGATSSITQTLPQLVAGRTYRTEYTISSVGGSGNIVLSLGGTAGTNRTANNTYVENIVCGATTTLDINVNTLRSCRIDNVRIHEALSFLPYSDASQAQSCIWHGGDVSPDTKWLIGTGVVSFVTTFTPSCWVLMDVLGCYPFIDMNSLASQTLSNATALTRYTTGAGVRAFLVSTVASGAVAHNITLSYTNQAGTSGRTMPVTVAGIASAVAGSVVHSFGGTLLNSYSPFFPLACDDYGIRSVDSIQLSAASGAGYAALVLCRPLASLPMQRAAQMTEQDMIFQKGALKKIEDGAYLDWLYMPNGNLVASSQGNFSILTGWG